jgi:hypothetical protein
MYTVVAGGSVSNLVCHGRARRVVALEACHTVTRGQRRNLLLAMSYSSLSLSATDQWNGHTGMMFIQSAEKQL